MDMLVFDNVGRTTDRYCLIIDNTKVYTVVSDPLSSSWGVRYLCHCVDLDRQEAGRLIKHDTLPEGLQNAIEMNGNTWFAKGQPCETDLLGGVEES